MMDLQSRKVVAVKSDKPVKLSTDLVLNAGDRLLVKGSSGEMMHLVQFDNDRFVFFNIDRIEAENKLQLIEAPALPMPPELEGWAVKECHVDSIRSQESACYQMTLSFDGVPAVHAKNDGHGGADLIIGIGARGSKHRLVDAFYRIFIRLQREGLIAPEDARLIESNDELFMQSFMDPLLHGFHLIHPLEQCVAKHVSDIAAYLRQHNAPSK